MHFCYILWIISLIDLLHGIRASSCTADHCEDKPAFTSSRVVVKFGDGFTVNCSICQHACLNRPSGLEVSRGDKKKTENTAIWTVDKMDIWDTSAICYYTPVGSKQCCSTLPVTVYKPPDDVSFSFVHHTGPLFEGKQYTLQCSVQNVAPVENLIVTFYGGGTALAPPQSKNITEKKPVNETFTLDITLSKEDDGFQYWCDARLDLGPEGPKSPPVVKSQNITTNVYYKPQLEGPSDPEPIILTEGNPLQLNCSAWGNPSPSYTWTHSANKPLSSSGSVFTISSVTTQDEGLYTCTASNEAGNTTARFKVEVKRDFTLYIILGIIIAVSVMIVVAVIVYLKYYKKNKTGQYNLKNVLGLRSQHTAVPSEEKKLKEEERRREEDMINFVFDH